MRKFMIYTFVAFLGVFIFIELYIRLFGNYCEPYFDNKEKIVKRKRYSEGIYKTEFITTGYFRINNEGWNSHRDYFRRHKSGNGNQELKKLRIAIVGHSNIEGLRVRVDKSLSKVLEDDLNEKGIFAEVYTFGFGGMHLAQALHVSRYAVQQFQPDLLIIGTMLEDFWAHSTNKKSFLNLTVNNTEAIQEILPQKYYYEENSPFSFLYFSKLIYYVDKNLRIGEKLNLLFKKVLKQRRENKKQVIITQSELEYAYQHIAHEFQKIANIGSDEIPIFFLKFLRFVPSHNYDFIHFKSFTDAEVNLLEKFLYENDFRLIELGKPLLNDYNINRRKFDFRNDYHYNEQAHKVIGLCIANHVFKYLKH